MRRLAQKQTMKYSGINASLFFVAIFNGAIYGVIVWLIDPLADRAGLIQKKPKPTLGAPSA